MSGKSPCELSYVLTTRNKLPLLREVLSRLLARRLPDEEIIVIDAESTDGTAEFLQSLLAKGEIQQFLSEPDKGEAHGLNKGLMLAHGTIIKPLSDDDVYCWDAIHECKDFLLAHPEVDVLGGLTACVKYEQPDDILVMHHYQKDAQDWLARNTERFFSNGLSLMLRRDRLPLLGLFHTGFMCVDLEFTLRVTGLASFGWYDSVMAIRVDNAASNFRTRRAVADRELVQMAALYNWVRYEDRHRPPPPGLLQELRRLPRQLLSKSVPRQPSSEPPVPAKLDATQFPSEVFQACERWLESYHRQHPGQVKLRANVS